MGLPQIIAVIVLYAIGALGSCAWATAEGATWVLGFILWTSFFAFCNAVTWALWWSREHWMP